MLQSMLAARMERTGETPLEMFANAEGRVAELLSIQPNTGYELPFLLAEDIAAAELDAARFTRPMWTRSASSRCTPRSSLQ